jgi:hypothetical protein
VGRSVTESGRDYLAVGRDALDRIAVGTERLIQRQRSDALRVSTSPDFAAKQLLHRLGLFEAHPDIDLRVAEALRKGKERRITRWEHEHVVEAVQTRLDKNPQAMRVRRQTVEHPFATLKMRMGATHFLMRRLKNVATEMALNVLGYNLTRVMNIVGVKPLLAAMRA